MNTGFLGPAVATVLTVYGIETNISMQHGQTFGLQQYLPFTVLKHKIVEDLEDEGFETLQQYLPFTVLKP